MRALWPASQKDSQAQRDLPASTIFSNSSSLKHSVYQQAMLVSRDLYPVGPKLLCLRCCLAQLFGNHNTPVIAEMPGCLIILLADKILDCRMPCYILICKQYIFSSVQVFLMKYIQTYTKGSSRCLSDIQMSLFFYLLHPTTNIAIRLWAVLICSKDFKWEIDYLWCSGLNPSGCLTLPVHEGKMISLGVTSL